MAALETRHPLSVHLVSVNVCLLKHTCIGKFPGNVIREEVPFTPPHVQGVSWRTREATRDYLRRNRHLGGPMAVEPVYRELTRQRRPVQQGITLRTLNTSGAGNRRLRTGDGRETIVLRRR